MSPPSSPSSPWLAFPPCPRLDLSKAQNQGLVTLPSGIQLWHAIFGSALSTRTAQPPIFFLHGGVSHSGYYADQIEYFSRKRTVIVFDNRGHGRSPLGSDAKLTYDNIADDIIGIMDMYKIPKAALVGWSDGAVMGWSVLARHPHRVDRLWAYGAVDDYRKTDGERVAKIPMVQEYFGRMQKEWEAMNPGGDYGTMIGRYVDMWSSSPTWDKNTFSKVPIRGEREDAPIVWIVTGDYDDWIPEETHDRFRSYIKNSRYLIMPGTGHLAFIQTPRLYNALVECFLEDGTSDNVRSNL